MEEFEKQFKVYQNRKFNEVEKGKLRKIS